jgi:hypothetical protein
VRPPLARSPEDALRCRQEPRRDPERLAAIEIYVDEATGRLPQKDAEVGWLAVEVLLQIGRLQTERGPPGDGGFLRTEGDRDDAPPPLEILTSYVDWSRWQEWT